MRSHALSSGRPARDTTGEAVEDATVGEVDSAPGGEWVPPPNIRPGTTVNSPSPDTGKVTDVQEAKKWLCTVKEANSSELSMK